MLENWNLRVSAALHQGDRKYMEDQYAIHYECDKETGKFLYVYFGIFDGHGGADAAKYTKANLHKNITSNILFFSEDTADVKKSIRDGFIKTHEDMWKELGKWPTTATGLPSTAGTTVSVVFIKGHKIYTGHVGDSGISIGHQREYLGRGQWQAEHMTTDHKPDSPVEKTRIEEMGGRVIPKAGVPRVVWQRPRQKGPVRRAHMVDHIPFLAVGRGLGDLWSYNFENREYAISPEPDVEVRDFNAYQNKCLVLATDGLWNLLDEKAAVQCVEMTERKWFREAIYEKGFPKTGNPYYHHASTLVNMTLRRWRARNLRADNTSAIVVLIDPHGPSVHKSLEKITKLAETTRAKGEKFCCRTYLKGNEEKLEDTERYVLGMAGSYNIQYYDDRDRFELHYGKPAERFNVPRNASTERALSSVAMYDVIIHKVMTPAKSSSNMAGLQTGSFSRLRKSHSSKELRKFRPQVGATLNGSWAEGDKSSPLPLNNSLSHHKSQPSLSTNAGYLRKTESPDSELISSDYRLSLNSETKSDSPPQEVPSPTVSSPETSRPDLTTTSPPSSHTEKTTTSRTNQVMKKLKGVAKSIASLHGYSKPATRRSTGALGAKPESTTGRNLRRTSKRTLVVPTSPLKVKRRTSSVDLLSAKRQKLSTPCVQLTKVNPVEEPKVTRSICLRPRQKS